MSITFSAQSFIEDSEETWGAMESVNVSNVNARFLLENLGLEFDYSGAVDAEQFLGAILVAQGIAPVDEGRPWNELPGPGMRTIDGGRRPGYLQDQLLELTKVAQQAKELGRRVQWA